MRAVSKIALAIWLLPPWVCAQEKNNGAPAVVSADALEYGAALEHHAAGDLLDWAGEFVEDELRWSQPDLKGIVDAVDDAFPSLDLRTRDAVVYLVMYLAYEDQHELEDSFTRQIHDYENEKLDIRDELERWQRYGVPPPGITTRSTTALSPSREIGRRLARLHELETRSHLRGNQLREIRARVNFFLKVLHKVYPSFQSFSPEKLDSVAKRSAPPA